MPDHPAILRAAAHDFGAFAEGELRERKELRWPPWSRILRFVALATRREIAEEMAEGAKQAVEAASPGTKVLGPAPTFLEQFKGKHRFHFLPPPPLPPAPTAAVAPVSP